MAALMKKIWKNFEKAAFFVGNAIASLMLLIFYYTIFALFALPFRIFSGSAEVGDSTWNMRSGDPLTLEDLKGE